MLFHIFTDQIPINTAEGEETAPNTTNDAYEYRNQFDLK